MMANEPEFSKLRAHFTAVARAEWNELLAADDREPNVELLAAYVDGALDESGRESVANHIAESPRAWALLQAMLESGQLLPMLDDSANTRSPTNSTSESASLPRPQRSAARPTSMPIYATAASLLLAITLGVVALHSTAQRRDLEARFAQTRQLDAERLRSTRELVRSVKQNVEDAAVSFSPPVFIGSSDASHILASLRKAVSGGFRGPDEIETVRLSVAAADAQRSISSAIQSFPEESFEFRIEEAAVLIAAGKLDAADAVLKSLEGDRPVDPRLLNARGAWLIHKAVNSPAAEAEPLLVHAESLLKSVASEEPLVWLNLFELHNIRGDRGAAAAAIRSYAEAVPDPEIRSFVKLEFGNRRN